MQKGEKASLLSPLKFLIMVIVAALVLPNLMNMPQSTVAILSPQITIDPSSGYSDTDIRVRGTDFATNTNVTIKWQSLSYWKLFATTNSLGAFDVLFNVPNGLTAGTYVVTAIDDRGNTASATFTLYFAYVDAGAFGIKTPKLNV